MSSFSVIAPSITDTQHLKQYPLLSAKLARRWWFQLTVGCRAGPRIRRRLAGGSARRRRRRTAFSSHQLQQLRAEYDRCHYISDERRRQLADRLGLHVTTIKVWFQNRRASDKKASGVCNELALRLMAEGLYDHHTVDVTAPTLY